ncbi:dTMP kinase [uncultured Methylibium sp.]|uniref:dTMP kinase n=1 Tax=uncultured Methylibium sp. TaxID=381093 RepID=UPI0025DC90A6|nr:dTMP kinase [uncultured Methylibium sp.]
MSATQAGPAGRFISFEGIDGAGKSSHIEPLAERWRQRGIEVLRTREPGGTPLAESLRDLILHRPMDALTEALLIFAARRDHLERVIQPALDGGVAVLCDRFTDASFAYQGAGRGFDQRILATLEAWVQSSPAGLRQPDLTLWFDLDPALAAERLAAARAPDRFEQQDAAFFERVRSGYGERCAAEPRRFVRIDAGQSREAVAAQVAAALAARGW